jgi:hypothetical protein
MHKYLHGWMKFVSINASTVKDTSTVPADGLCVVCSEFISDSLELGDFHNFHFLRTICIDLGIG